MFRLDVVQPSWAISYLDDVIDDTKQELSEIEALLDNPQMECSRESKIKMRMRYAYVLGRYYYQNGRDEEGCDALDQMLCFARSLHQERYLADAYLRMIFQSIDNMEIEKTTYYIQLAEQNPHIIENLKLMALVHHYKAVVAYRNGRFDTAEKLLTDNIRLMQDLPMEHDVNAQIALDYYMLSTVMISRKEREKAEGYLQMSTRFYRGSEQDASSAMISLNYGILAYQRKEYKKAMEKLRACERFFIRSAFDENRGYLFAYLLIVSRILGFKEEAERYVEICRELSGTLKNPTERDFVEKCYISNKPVHE
jgi:tetratricopeptide (TPR) repeat protein